MHPHTNLLEEIFRQEDPRQSYHTVLGYAHTTPDRYEYPVGDSPQRDRRGEDSLRYRNRAESTFRMSEQCRRKSFLLQSEHSLSLGPLSSGLQ